MISIIIPLYNVEKYIKNCLISLEKQSYKNFEVIIVNDGSPDNSVDIVRAFMEQSDLNIKLIDQENSGVSIARNTGISYINGDYVCFMDSDDMYDTEYLAIMRKEIESHNADICICRSHRIQELDNTIYTFDQEYTTDLYTKDGALSAFLYGKFKAGIWAVLAKREILGDMKFAENFRYSEDLEMVWRLIAVSQKIVRISARLYCYRVRGGSAMAKMDSRRLDGLKLFENLESFIAVNAPNFHPQYKKHGVARWVWATVWQEALASQNYREFCERAKKYSPKMHMKKLFTYKNRLVCISSVLFVYFKVIYYFLIRFHKRKYRKLS